MCKRIRHGECREENLALSCKVSKHDTVKSVNRNITANYRNWLLCRMKNFSYFISKWSPAKLNSRILQQPCVQLCNVLSNFVGLDWIGLCSVLRPRQHSIGYMGDGFYRSKDPTNSINVLKEKAVKENNSKNTKKTKITHMHTQTK